MCAPFALTAEQQGDAGLDTPAERSWHSLCTAGSPQAQCPGPVYGNTDRKTAALNTPTRLHSNKFHVHTLLFFAVVAVHWSFTCWCRRSWCSLWSSWSCCLETLHSRRSSQQNLMWILWLMMDVSCPACLCHPPILNTWSEQYNQSVIVFFSNFYFLVILRVVNWM